MRNIVYFLIVIIPVLGNAQIENKSNWQLSYYGDLIFHPGFQVGYHVPFKKWEKVKQRKGIKVTKNKSLSWGADFIYYKHPKHHHGLVLSPNISYQRIKQNGNYFQTKFSLGYHRSFVDGITYIVDVNGQVESKRFVGQGTLYNSLSFDFGKDLRVRKDKPFRYFFQIGISGRFPHNKAYLPSIHSGLGIHYFFKSNKK